MAEQLATVGGGCEEAASEGVDGSADDLDSHVEMAVIEQHLSTGRFTEALRCSDAMLQSDRGSTNPDLHSKRGIALAQLGDLLGAVNAFRTAVRLCPGRAPYWRNLGVALGQLRRFAESVEAHRRAVALEPANPVLLRMLAEVERATGNVDEARAALESALVIERGGDGCRAYVDLLKATGRPLQAAGFLESLLADNEPTTPLLNALGLCQLHGGELDLAARAFEAALRLDPRDVDLHLNLAVCHARGGHWALAVAEYDQGLLLHRAKPRRWRPALDREVAQIGLLHNAEPSEDRQYLPPPSLRAGDQKLLTVLVGCYGDFPHYSIRALDSIAAGRDLRQHCDVLLGLNACCQETTNRARDLADAGVADAVVESRPNINKDPMMRVLLDMVRTPYVVWLDDDSHFVDPGWPLKLAKAVEAEHPFDVAGQPGRWGPHRFRDAAYAAFVRQRPWFHDEAAYDEDLREWIPFIIGGLFVARTEYLRQHDYPDRGMVKAADDVMLGELIQQRGGRLLVLSEEVQALARFGDGDRRGENFELSNVT